MQGAVIFARTLVARTLAVLALAALPLPSHAADDRFDILRFEIEGNTLLPQNSAEAAVAVHAGPQRDYGDVQKALESLEREYRKAGFGTVLVHVPEQELGGGIVRLSVIEAKLGRINLDYQPAGGEIFFSPENVRASLPGLREGSVPNTPAIAEAVQLANENPARQVEVVLKAGEDTGFIDAQIAVQATDPKKLFFTLDNTGSESTGKHRLGVGFQHANLFGRDHSFTINYSTSPENPGRVSQHSLSYRLPLYALGDSLDFILAKSDIDAGSTATVAGPLQFTGKGDVLGLRYNWLLPRSGEYSHRVIAGLDHRSFDNTCTLGSFGASGCGPAGVDVAVRPWSIAYAGQWQQPRQAASFSFAYFRNWPGTSHGREADFNAARPNPAGSGGASANYDLVRLNGSFMKGFTNDVQVRAAASAQHAPDPLISVEQFGLAGASAVRGFAERETARDSGFVLNLEVYSPNYASRLGIDGGNLRATVFYDHAAGRNNALAGETAQSIQIASWGMGLRLALGKSLNTRLDAAQVLDGDSLRRRHDTLGHFSVNYAF